MATPNVTRLLLFRHGRTAWNVEERLQGCTDVPMDDFGRMQMDACIERAAFMDPSTVYSSDLIRCSEPARMLADRSGIPLVLDRRLRERDFGFWAGHTAPELEERFPDEYLAWTQGRDQTVGGGESREQLAARVRETVLGIVSQYSGHTVAVFSHGGCINSIARWLDATEASRPHSKARNGSLSVVETTPDNSLRLAAFNDVGHLHDLVNTASFEAQ